MTYTKDECVISIMVVGTDNVIGNQVQILTSSVAFTFVPMISEKAWIRLFSLQESLKSRLGLLDLSGNQPGEGKLYI